MKITYTVPGRPIAAPRMTQSDRWKQRPCVVQYRSWKDLIRLHCSPIPAALEVVSLSWVAYFAPPESWSKKKKQATIGTLHRTKPDRDNLDKALLDALFPDGDQAIAQGTIRKEWGTFERLEITIETEG